MPVVFARLVYSRLTYFQAWLLGRGLTYLSILIVHALLRRLPQTKTMIPNQTQAKPIKRLRSKAS